MKNEYALYKGDEFIAIGSIKEIADILGVKKETIRFYSSPVYKKRVKSGNGMVLINLGAEE